MEGAVSSVGKSVDRTGRTPVWLRVLYEVALLSAGALALMLLKELIEVWENGSGRGHEEGLHDLAIFDIAWLVFVLSWLFTLIAALTSLIVGLAQRTRQVLRYSMSALGFCLVSALIAAVAAA